MMGQSFCLPQIVSDMSLVTCVPTSWENKKNMEKQMRGLMSQGGSATRHHGYPQSTEDSQSYGIT